MSPRTPAIAEPRTPLSRERVLEAAVAIADRDGLPSLTMRNLAQALGVEAMSIYHHLPSKEAVLDGMVEMVVAEINETVASIPPPAPPDEWKDVARRRILVARRILLGHPWAPAVIESRSALSPEVIRYFDGLLAILRAGGLSWDLSHHALHALGSRALGFSQELFAPDDVEAGEEAAGDLLEQMADHVPNLVGMMAEIAHDDPGSTLGWCDDQSEFEFGLDLLLDGLDRHRRASL